MPSTKAKGTLFEGIALKGKTKLTEQIPNKRGTVLKKNMRKLWPGIGIVGVRGLMLVRAEKASSFMRKPISISLKI